MTKLSTSEQYKVGIESIDQAHGELFALITELKDITDSSLPSDRGQVVKHANYVLNRLLDYTVSHFAEEEYLLELFHVPGRNAHKKAHRVMERKLIELYRGFKEEGLVVLPAITKLLEKWWVQHILNLDLKDLEGIHEHETPEGQQVFNKSYMPEEDQVG